MSDDNLIHTRFNELSPAELDERLESIDKLRRRSERQPALVFKGRESIRKNLRDSVSDLRDAGSSEGFLRVIQGAPGAGKTSLLYRLEQDLSGDDVTCIRVQSNTLNYPKALFNELFSRLGGSVENAMESLNTRISERVGSSGARITGEKEIKKPAVSELIGEEEPIWSILKRTISIAPNHVVVLLVDETQQQKENMTDSFRRFAQQLGSGDTSGIKILPVFAGLRDSVDTLAICGLSRLPGRPIQLSALSRLEAAEVVHDTLNLAETGLAGMFTTNGVQRISTELAIACEGWPRHLHAYLTAFAAECVACITEDPSRSINLDSVLDRGHVARLVYYDDRLARIETNLIQALIEWVAQNQIQECVIINSLLDCATDRGLTDERDRQRLEAGIDDALREGVIQQHGSNIRLGDKRFEFPIASMRTYLHYGGVRDKTIHALREIHKEQLFALQRGD